MILQSNVDNYQQHLRTNRLTRYLGSNSYKEVVTDGTSLADSGVIAHPPNLDLEQEERLEAEIHAAKRSLQTNASFILIFSGLILSLVLVDRSLRPGVTNLLLTSIKAILPLFTAIANFGTVHNVLVTYIQSVKSTLLNRTPQ